MRIDEDVARLQVAFVAGMPWGPVGVAAACSITYCVLRPMGIAYCLRPTCLEVSDLSQALYRPGLATAVACLLLFATGEIAPLPGGAPAIPTAIDRSDT